ncbi:hypothetical protein [Meridianimarinicoccus aquatilis]|uniref:Lipoprotein n=1 Tax=Meridianimarinicoccus aquatilis TaxID=2552766 RepID=A0A4R6AUD1_9RHOB|nr:hypothetical protein [Fluviibacterium aquatile]QIE42195.1 hypothetical protein G5B39_09700 [Rhodobacteraceae bacterium SC52]TDL85826.1 hypothetical protein E2L05_14545 [Fluviibacterium aquatile]
MTQHRRFPLFRSFPLLVALGLAGCEYFDVPQPSYVARNDLRVYQMGDGRFEVLALPGTSGGDYFCAAGDYARTMRNAPAASRVSVVRPNGPTDTVPNGRSMIFEITQQGPRTLPVFTNAPMNTRGASFTVAMAQLQCWQGRGAGYTFR